MVPLKSPRILYGWAISSGVCVSHIAPDVAQLPRSVFPSVAEAERHMTEQNAQRRRQTVIVWSGSALAEKQILDAKRVAESPQWSQSH